MSALQISSKTNYALLAVVDIAVNGKDEVVSVSDIANRHELSKKFLEQVLMLLRRGGIVIGRRGAKGGYLLARKASKISLLDVLLLMEDSILKKSSSSSGLKRLYAVPILQVWNDVNNQITARLASVSIQQIADEVSLLIDKEASNYSI